ncbi:MAG: hypothetical protein FGM24_03845 [Candidatus Kapabacteria bacterium]|nr:hypothetical protein [Candidatus Kapabacteria bacterium]
MRSFVSCCILAVWMACPMMGKDSTAINIAVTTGWSAYGISADPAMSNLQFGARYYAGSGSSPSLIGVLLTVGNIGVNEGAAVATARLHVARSTAAEESDMLYLPIDQQTGYLDYVPMRYHRDLRQSMLLLDLGYGYSTQRLVLSPKLRLGYVLDAETKESLVIEEPSDVRFTETNKPEPGTISADGQTLVIRTLPLEQHQRFRMGIGASIGYAHDLGPVRLGLDTHVIFDLLQAYKTYTTKTTDVGLVLYVGWTLP